MNCLICDAERAEKAELELHFGNPKGDVSSIVVDIGLCGQCWGHLKSYAGQVDTSADRREAFEEAFFSAAVRFWFRKPS